MSLTTIQHRPGKKKKLGTLDASGGLGLLTLFYCYCQTLHEDRLVDQMKKRYAHIEDVRQQGCAVVIDIEAGHFGNVGKTFNVKTHEIEHTRKDDHSATTHTRLALVVPPGSETGLFFIEREGISGGGPKVLELFKDALLGAFDQDFFPTEIVIEPDAWRQEAELSQITATAKKWRSNLAAGMTTTAVPLGKLKQEFVPESGLRHFPRWFRDAVISRQLDMSAYLGFADDADVEVVVELEKEGRAKSFVVGKERTPTVRMLLSDDGQPPMTNPDFLMKVFREAEDYYTSNGYTWQTGWEQASWNGVNLGGDWNHGHKSP